MTGSYKHHDIQAWRNKHTVSNFLASSLDARLKLVKGIKRRKDLDAANSIQHVCIMAWGSAEAAALVQARKDKVQNFCAWEGIGLA
jgi:hypothetical protein